jgi:hypothetical protein
MERYKRYAAPPNAPEASGADMDAFRDELSTAISLEMMMSKAC